MTGARRQNEGTDPWLIVTAVLAIVLVVLVALAALFLLGAGDEGGSADASPSTPAASAGPSATSSAPSPSTDASVPASPGGSAAPSTTPSTAPTASSSTAPSASAGASPSPSASPDASACSGSDENRVFFAQAADKLGFEAYCAVLPGGWSLVSGSYRSADGGRFEIAYKGPGGATLRLRQGPNACDDDPACPPTGSEEGAASFGDRGGTLLATASGFAVLADGSPALYIAETTGLSADATSDLAAGLIPIR